MVDKLYIIRPVFKLDNFKIRQEYKKLQGKKYNVKAVWDDIYLNYPEVEAEIERSQKVAYLLQIDNGFTGSFEDFLEYAKKQGIDRKYKWLLNSAEVFNKILETWEDKDDYVIDNGIQMTFKQFRESKKGDARFYTKVINSTNRDGRNNIIFDTIYAILTSEQAMDLVFTPGNFDEPKKYGYMAAALSIYDENSIIDFLVKDKSENEKLKIQEKYKDKSLYEIINSLDIDTLKDAISKNKNLVYNNTHLAFHKQNMVAGKLIGIFAQNNVSHSIISLIDLSVKTDSLGNVLYDLAGKSKIWKPTIIIEQPVIEIEGEVIGGGEIPFDTLEDKQGRRISNVLAAFLAASVDAVKDPVLNYMNINETTAGILTSLIRMGYDTELAMLFLTLPIIKDIIVLYSIKNEGGYTSLDSIIQETIDNINEDDIDIDSLMLPSIDKQTLIKTLKNPSVTENINLLRALKALNDISRVTSAIVSITKFNSVTAAAGPMLSDTMLMKQRVYKNLQMDELQTESMQYALDNPIIKTFRDKEFEAVDKLFRGMMLQANSQFDRIVSKVQDSINGTMDSQMINKLSNFYMSFLLASTENPIFKTEDNDNPISESRREYIYKTLPWKIKKLKKQSDNRFLKLLRIMPADDSHEYYWLKINTRGMIGSVHDEVGLYWQELYQENPELAMELIEYNFIVSGLGFTPNSFANLIPVPLKRAIPNYVLLLNPDRQLNTEEENRLIDQFIRNNHSDYKIVKRILKIPKNDIIFGTKYILISNQVSSIQKDSDSFYDYISYYNKLYKKVGTKANKVKYIEVSKLGGKYGEILEINPSGEVEPINLKPKKKTNKNSTKTKKEIYSEEEVLGEVEVDDGSSKNKKTIMPNAMAAQIQLFILNKVPESEQSDRIARLRRALYASKNGVKAAPKAALKSLLNTYGDNGYYEKAFSLMTSIDTIIENAIRGIKLIDQDKTIQGILDTKKDINACD